METVEFFLLPPEDWQAYKQIRLEALQDAPQAFGSSYAESVQRPDAFWQQRVAEAFGAGAGPTGQKSWLVFARLGNQIVGTIGAYISDEAAQSGTADTAQIIGVYVRPAARGKGIASALMEAIQREVTRSGSIRRLTLGVNVQQAAALALYRRSGFTITGSVRMRMGDGNEHEEYLMEKWVGEIQDHPPQMD
jgi:ribosomal protein S18 acetylase RimI-like enzyme